MQGCRLTFTEVWVHGVDLGVWYDPVSSDFNFSADDSLRARCVAIVGVVVEVKVVVAVRIPSVCCRPLISQFHTSSGSKGFVYSSISISKASRTSNHGRGGGVSYLLLTY